MISTNPFPVEILPLPIKHAVQEVQAVVQAPVELIVASALGAISLAAQGAIDVRRPNGLTSPCSLYLLVIAESGERKSTVDRLFTQPFRFAEQCHAEHSEKKRIQYEAEWHAWQISERVILTAIEKRALKGDQVDDLVERLQAHLSNKPKKNRTVKLLYSDATPEAFAYGLVENWRSAGIVSDEAGSIFDGRTLSNLGMFCKVWDGSPWAVDRRTSMSFRVEEARATLILMIQEHPFRKFLRNRGGEAHAIGWFARQLMAYPASTQGSRILQNRMPSWQYLPVFQDRIAEILTRNIQDMEDEHFARKVVGFSPEAGTYWTDMYNRVEGDLRPGAYLSDVKDYAAKFAENVARMAALFHHFEASPGDISLYTLQRAVQVCSWYLEEFKRLFASGPEVSMEQADAYQLELWLGNLFRRSGMVRIRKNEIRQFGPNALRSKPRLDAALKLLSSWGRIWFIRVGKTSLVEVNVQYFSGYTRI